VTAAPSPGTHDERLTRSQLLRRAGVAAAAVAGAGTSAPDAVAGPAEERHQLLKGRLSIVQWSHFVPRYDAWFDGTWAKAWGEKNDVQVDVDPESCTLLPALAAA